MFYYLCVRYFDFLNNHIHPRDIVESGLITASRMPVRFAALYLQACACVKPPEVNTETPPGIEPEAVLDLNLNSQKALKKPTGFDDSVTFDLRPVDPDALAAKIASVENSESPKSDVGVQTEEVKPEKKT